jgi:N-acetyl-beta-hexosaminidase
MYKFNRFHWHLTDDQGWRIEIKKYPQLTAVGAWRNGTITGRYPGNGNDGIKYGGYYTQEEIKELIKYAADRFISIIPEIEMPGHASAAIAAYPQLSCFPEEDTQHPAESAWNGSTKGKQVQQTWGVFEDVFCPGEFTFNFLQDVLDEIMDLFPSEYIHIGGDECPKESWKRSAFCKQLMKEKGLKNEHELQSYFIQRIEKYVNSKGKKIIGWDEILEGGLAPNATVMSWRGEEGGIVAAQQNHDVVMTPGDWCYFDHSQSKNEDSVTIGGYLPLENVYGYDPIPAALPAEKVAKLLPDELQDAWLQQVNASQQRQAAQAARRQSVAQQKAAEEALIQNSTMNRQPKFTRNSLDKKILNNGIYSKYNDSKFKQIFGRVPNVGELNSLQQDVKQALLGGNSYLFNVPVTSFKRYKQLYQQHNTGVFPSGEAGKKLYFKYLMRQDIIGANPVI